MFIAEQPLSENIKILFSLDIMANPDSRVTIHMVASLDGFIARKDGRVDWLETSDEFADGATLEPGFVVEFLKTIDEPIRVAVMRLLREAGV